MTRQCAEPGTWIGKIATRSTISLSVLRPKTFTLPQGLLSRTAPPSERTTQLRCKVRRDSPREDRVVNVLHGIFAGARKLTQALLSNNRGAGRRQPIKLEASCVQMLLEVILTWLADCMNVKVPKLKNITRDDEFAVATLGAQLFRAVPTIAMHCGWARGQGLVTLVDCHSD